MRSSPLLLEARVLRLEAAEEAGLESDLHQHDSILSTDASRLLLLLVRVHHVGNKRIRDLLQDADGPLESLGGMLHGIPELLVSRVSVLVVREFRHRMVPQPLTVPPPAEKVLPHDLANPLGLGLCGQRQTVVLADLMGACHLHVDAQEKEVNTERGVQQLLGKFAIETVLIPVLYGHFRAAIPELHERTPLHCTHLLCRLGEPNRILGMRYCPLQPRVREAFLRRRQ